MLTTFSDRDRHERQNLLCITEIEIMQLYIKKKNGSYEEEGKGPWRCLATPAVPALIGKVLTLTDSDKADSIVIERC